MGTEHLRDLEINFHFPYKVCLYCDPSVPSINGSSQTFDDFNQIPQKLGWNFREDGDSMIIRCSATGIDAVTQRWLYFEVLAQVFGHLPEYDWQDFISSERSNIGHVHTQELARHIDRRVCPEWVDIRYVHTQELSRYIDRWLDSEREEQDSARSKHRLVRIQQVLDKARMWVSRYCTPSSFENNTVWEVDGLLALSFIILGETLTRAFGLIQKRNKFQINNWCSYDSRILGWGYCKLVLEKLETDGWCAKAVQMLRTLLRGNCISLLYLLSMKESNFKGLDHARCTKTLCRESIVQSLGQGQAKLDQPLQYHHCANDIPDIYSEPQGSYVQDGQAPRDPICTTVEDFDGKVNGREIATIIKRGNIPLFQFHRKTRKLSLQEMKQSFDKQYAIFSHVWTDGFGSPNDENRMSLCVLNMFSKILEEVSKQRTGDSSRAPELFWIDTLAIPTKGKFAKQRNQAIGQMHNIYAHANYTIVLDLGLIRVPMGSGYSNPAMRISMCKWMTRLWTLQEAVLSKNLYFCFKDHIQPMSLLEDLFLDEDGDFHSYMPSLARTYFAGIHGEVQPKIYEEFRKDEGWLPSSDFLALVWEATQWRSTAHPIHETLSLATMLSLNTGDFASPSNSKEGTEEYQRECGERMIMLLSRVAAMSPCPIPPGLIFLPGPRLTKKGYGWAPQTWLSSREIDSPDPPSLLGAGNTRLDPSEGLEVQFPGFLLHDLGGNRDDLCYYYDFFLSTSSTLPEWYIVERAEDVIHFPRPEKIAGRDLAIIASRLPAVDLRERLPFWLQFKECTEEFATRRSSTLYGFIEKNMEI
ncbi:MAG: hypothetical protein Q9190_004470 [Brigantiaea leucoxantha]